MTEPTRVTDGGTTRHGTIDGWITGWQADIGDHGSIILRGGDGRVRHILIKSEDNAVELQIEQLREGIEASVAGTIHLDPKGEARVVTDAEITLKQPGRKPDWTKARAKASEDDAEMDDDGFLDPDDANNAFGVAQAWVKSGWGDTSNSVRWAAEWLAKTHRKPLGEVLTDDDANAQLELALLTRMIRNETEPNVDLLRNGKPYDIEAVIRDRGGPTE